MKKQIKSFIFLTATLFALVVIVSNVYGSFDDSKTKAPPTNGCIAQAFCKPTYPGGGYTEIWCVGVNKCTSGDGFVVCDGERTECMDLW